jgi:hypothetical protein
LSITTFISFINTGNFYVNQIISYANSQGWNIPSSDTITAMVTLVDSMLSSYIWDKFDVFYMFGYNSTSLKNFARINWKSPGNFNITYPTGDCDYDTGGFYKGDDGTTDDVYGLDTNFISNTNGVNYTQDNASIGFYGYNNASSIETTFTLIVDNSSSIQVRLVFGPKTSNLIQTYNINGGVSQITVYSLLSNTLKTINRTSSSSTNFYNSGALVETDTSTSTSLSNTSMLLLRNTGYFVFNYSSLFWMGSSLDATENSNINTYINTFRTSVGL